MKQVLARLGVKLVEQLKTYSIMTKVNEDLCEIRYQSFILFYPASQAIYKVAMTSCGINTEFQLQQV